MLHSLNFKDTPADDQWKECVPKDQRPEILARYHDAPTAGHEVFFPAVSDRPAGFPGQVVDQIRKWGCHFDGKDPVAFFERLEELKDAYQISGAQILAGLPELLKGDALLWYRNNRHTWQSWEDFHADFREHYLPRGTYNPRKNRPPG